MMTKEEVMDLIINEYKNGIQSAMGDYCYRTKCNDCPFDSDNCTNESNNTLIERLLKAEKQSKSLEKTCYKLQQALEEHQETNLEHYAIQSHTIRDLDISQLMSYNVDTLAIELKEGWRESVNWSDPIQWLLSPYEPPKYKLSKFEHDLIDFCKQYNDTFVIKDWAVLMDMHDKGYFKDIPTDVPIGDILDNCEVVIND